MFDGFQLTDCAIAGKDRFFFSFINAQEYASEDCAVFTHAASKELAAFIAEGDSWHVVSETMAGTEIFHAEGDPAGGGIFIDAEGKVFGMGDQGIERLQPLTEAMPNVEYAPVANIKLFCGHLYGCGPAGTLFRRMPSGAWENLALSAQNAGGGRSIAPALRKMICTDIDGFAPDDVYVVGGVGGICHFNGEDWRQLPFPSNYLLSALCCGGDGFVYAAGQSGTVFKGRGDRWSLLHRGNLNLAFKDMVWFRDTLWCANDFGLWRLQEDRLAPLRVAPEIDACAGRLAVGAGQMLMGGTGGAAVFEENYCYLLFELNWRDSLDYEALGS